MIDKIKEIISSLEEGILIPSNISDPNKDFFFLLKENDFFYEGIIKNDKNIFLNIAFVKLKKNEDIIDIAFIYTVINSKYFYCVPFVLNNKSDRDLFHLFLDSEYFNIFLSNGHDIGKLGRFKKAVIEYNEIWDNLIEEVDSQDILISFFEKFKGKELFNFLESLN